MSNDKSKDSRTRGPFQKFAIEVILVAIAQFFSRGRGLIVLPIIAKSLGVVNYGIYSQVLVTIGLFSPFALLGLHTGMRRLLPGEKDEQKVKSVFWAALAIIMFNSLVLVGGLYLFSPLLVEGVFKVDEAVFFLRVAAILIPVFVINQVFLEYFVVFKQSRKYMYLSLLKDITFIGLVAYFLLSRGGGILALIIISIVTTALCLFISAFIIIRQLGLCLPRLSGIKGLKPYFEVSLPLFIGGYGQWIVHSSDRYVIGYFMNMASVGIYSLVYTLCGTIIVLSGPIYFVLLPTISRLWDNDKKDEVKTYLKYTLKYIFILLVPAAFGLSVLGKQILEVLATADFTVGWFLIPIIASGMVILQSLSGVEYVLILVKRTDIILKVVMLTAVENIILNIILVPVLGILGAGIATFITYLTLAVIIWKVAAPYLRVGLDYLLIGKVVFASVLMSLGVYFFNFEGISGLLITILAGALLYFLILFILKGISIREIKLIVGKG